MNSQITVWTATQSQQHDSSLVHVSVNNTQYQHELTKLFLFFQNSLGTKFSKSESHTI